MKRYNMAIFDRDGNYAFDRKCYKNEQGEWTYDGVTTAKFDRKQYTDFHGKKRYGLFLK